MNLEHVPAQVTIVAGQHGVEARRLHGHWLVLARMLWLAIFILTLVVFCANLLVGSYGLLTTILLFSLLLVLTGGSSFHPFQSR